MWSCHIAVVKVTEKINSNLNPYLSNLLRSEIVIFLFYLYTYSEFHS